MATFLQKYALALGLLCIVIINVPFLPFYQHISLLFTLPISFAVSVFFFTLYRKLDKFRYFISVPYLVIHLCGFLSFVYALFHYDEGLSAIMIHSIPAWVSTAFFCLASLIFYLVQKFLDHEWYGIYLVLALPIVLPIILLITTFIDKFSLLS
jgi:hypothetical protein